MIDEKKLIEERPEWLNPNCVGKEEYNKGWNACNKYWCNTIDRQPKVSEWIPVSERLPETEDKVMCCTETKKGNKNIVIGYYMDGAWRCGMNSNVIAWMPLPEPWKGESE